MKEITYYRTYSLGGVELKNIQKRDFETIELAKKDALLDTWNESFSLYEVKLIFNGTVTEIERKLESNIKCGRDIVIEKNKDKDIVPRHTNPKRFEFYASKKFDRREFIFYRTYSWGGVNGSEFQKRDFETIDLAIDDARKDTMSTGFKISEVKLVFSGRVEESIVGFEGKIKSGRDILLEKMSEEESLTNKNIIVR